MNEKQRDARLNEILYPLYDDKRVVEIIDAYEQDEEVRKRSTKLFTSLKRVKLNTYKYSFQNLQKQLPKMALRDT